MYIVSMTKNPEQRIEIELEDGRTAFLTLKPGFIARLVAELDDEISDMSVEEIDSLTDFPGMETDDWEFTIR